MWQFNLLGLLFLLNGLAKTDAPEHVRLAGDIPIRTRWTIHEFQPNVPEGGRANSFAVHPQNDKLIYVTSESGGLFRSINGGKNWKHIDSLPCFLTADVALVPGNPDIVLVTTHDDFKATSGGGIWRSTDGGFSWTQCAINVEQGIRPIGVDISIAPDSGNIYVGWNGGLLTSSDKGETWTSETIFPDGSNQMIYAVLALGNNRLIAGGISGVRYFDGTSWKPTNSPQVGGVWDLHALVQVPGSPLSAFVVNGDANLFFTSNGGADWTPISSAPDTSSGCGGICFVRVTRSATDDSLMLYFGNRCYSARLHCPFNRMTGQYDFGGIWTTLNADHGDTRDLVFSNSHSPLLLASDGGLHETSDGGANWTFVGGGIGGFNALQITEIQGQLIHDQKRHDLYYGTQDNHLYSSSDGGNSWTRGASWEGFFIELLPRVPTPSDSKMTYTACASCGNYLAGPLFSGISSWSNPPVTSPVSDPNEDWVGGNPKILGRSFHVQGVNRTGGLERGLASTSDLGTTWKQYATFPESRRDLPKSGPGRGLLSSLTLYQSIQVGVNSELNCEINHLARIRKSFLFPDRQASVSYPAMNNFGGLGINPTMFAWYQVFAVNPSDGNHLIAPDTIHARMMQSRDGGENWTELVELTDLVTDRGNYLFRKGPFPIVTTISFCPFAPQLILVGTSEGGMYLSQDGGTHWERIQYSEPITYATAIHWRSANEAIVSTYGRGLWRLTNFIYVRLPDFETLCRPPCVIGWIDPIPGRPPIDRSVLIYDGFIQGARLEQGIVEELFVSPGSSLFYAIRDPQTRPLKITETLDQVGIQGMERPVQAPDGSPIFKGIHLAADGRLVAGIFGDQVQTFEVAGPQWEVDGNPISPTAKRPYLRIGGPQQAGIETFQPGQTATVQGIRFEPGSRCEILIDQVPISVLVDGGVESQWVTADPNGNLSFAVTLPNRVGIHLLTIRKQGTKEVIQGSSFLVRHVDEDRD